MRVNPLFVGLLKIAICVGLSAGPFDLFIPVKKIQTSSLKKSAPQHEYSGAQLFDYPKLFFRENLINGRSEHECEVAAALLYTATELKGRKRIVAVQVAVRIGEECIARHCRISRGG